MEALEIDGPHVLLHKICIGELPSPTRSCVGETPRGHRGLAVSTRRASWVGRDTRRASGIDSAEHKKNTAERDRSIAPQPSGAYPATSTAAPMMDEGCGSDSSQEASSPRPEPVSECKSSRRESSQGHHRGSTSLRVTSRARSPRPGHKLWIESPGSSTSESPDPRGSHGFAGSSSFKAGPFSAKTLGEAADLYCCKGRESTSAEGSFTSKEAPSTCVTSDGPNKKGCRVVVDRDMLFGEPSLSTQSTQYHDRDPNGRRSSCEFSDMSSGGDTSSTSRSPLLPSSGGGSGSYSASGGSETGSPPQKRGGGPGFDPSSEPPLHLPPPAAAAFAATTTGGAASALNAMDYLERDSSPAASTRAASTRAAGVDRGPDEGVAESKEEQSTSNAGDSHGCRREVTGSVPVVAVPQPKSPTADRLLPRSVPQSSTAGDLPLDVGPDLAEARGAKPGSMMEDRYACAKEPCSRRGGRPTSGGYGSSEGGHSWELSKLLRAMPQKPDAEASGVSAAAGEWMTRQYRIIPSPATRRTHGSSTSSAPLECFAPGGSAGPFPGHNARGVDVWSRFPQHDGSSGPQRRGGRSGRRYGRTAERTGSAR